MRISAIPDAAVSELEKSPHARAGFFFGFCSGALVNESG
jgi:hypothetical protein